MGIGTNYPQVQVYNAGKQYTMDLALSIKFQENKV